VGNSKHYETSGPFAGLWVRTAGALRKAGYKSRRKVRADIEAGALHPYISIHDYGRYADREVRKWLGLKSWSECWGKDPIIIRRPRVPRGANASKNIGTGLGQNVFLV
jgi:hypothetical protein